MLNNGVNMLPATCCRLQSAASLHLCWARNVAELMRPAATSRQANEYTLLNLPFWLPSYYNISSFVIFPCRCVVSVCVLLFSVCIFGNVGMCLLMWTGKGWHRPKEGHRRHGSTRDQVRRLRLLRHACGDGTVAFLPGAWCQIISPRTPEKKGK